MARTKKVVITAFGDESKLAIVENDPPDPDSGEVQLSVEYSIVCGSDVNMRRGTYPLQRKPPLTPGYSVIGKVRVNGKGCSKFTIGDRVACLSKYEGQAELINLPEKPDLELLFEWLRAGRISVPVKCTFTLDQIQEAHREYAKGDRMGSIVIEVAP